MVRRVPKGSVAPTPVTPESLLEGLNPEQVEVVRHHTGPLLVGAVAGAGKTAALVRRVAYLVAVHQVSPSRILALTFSKKAADEMNARLEALLPNCGVRMGTFHSLGFEFMREEFPRRRIGNVEGGWRVDDGNRYRSVVKEVLGFRVMDWKGADLTEVLRFISLCKARCAPADTHEALEQSRLYYKERPCSQRSPENLYRAYSEAENLRQKRQLITFDDMLLEMWERLQNEHVRQQWAARYDFLLQDEGQDENQVQRAIAESLAKEHRSYMVVGDPAQAIYGFRGSDPSGILTFAQRWQAKVIHMHRNYRCGRNIVGVANGVLSSMAEGTHLGMRMTAECDTQGLVEGRLYSNADEEGAEVVRHIRQLHQDGVPYRHMVILYRTNAQSRAVEEACISDRVPYVVVGGTNFYERMEVKPLLAYLRLAGGKGTIEDVKRCVNAPYRYLGDAFKNSIEFAVSGGEHRAFSRTAKPNQREVVEWTEVVRGCAQTLKPMPKTAALQWCTLVESLGRVVGGARDSQRTNPGTPTNPESRPAALLERIVLETKYVEWLSRDEGSESPENNRVSNVRELIRASERFPTVDELLTYVEEQVDAARRNKGEDGTPERVTLMSIHRSKGLEWPVVFVVGVNEKVLPHARAEDAGEERRLAYVAFTRAKERLHVSCVEMAAVGSKVIYLQPSTYLQEAGIVLRGRSNQQGVQP